MKILITGASGYVGARIYSDLKKVHQTTGTYFHNNHHPDLVRMDVADLKSVRAVLQAHKPEVIVHNAAFPVSPQSEEQKKLVKDLNFKGIDHIVQVANEIGSKVVFISSAVALNLNDLYGQSKAYGEAACKKVRAGYLIIRPHTVFGYSPNMTNDRSFNRLLKNIFEKTPAIYDTSWKFQPTYIGHISEVILKYLSGEIKNELIGVAFDDLKSKYEIGNDLLRNFGIAVTPVDNKIDWPTIKLDLSDFKQLDLPVKSYGELMEVMTEEVKRIMDAVD